MQWLARGEAAIPAGASWLTELEVRRAEGMRFTKRRTEYLLRRYAGKCAVAATLGMSEDPSSLGRIGVLNAPTGAPYVVVDGTRIPMDVSLTDRAGWAVCLVGPDLGAVGCDLEIVEPRSAGFVRDFLTIAEQDLVAAAAQSGRDARDAAANLIWSAKESALKVLRTGLRADTRTVEVSLPSVDRIARPDAAWHPMDVTTILGRLPGWWRRDGLFLLTVVTGAGVGAAGPPTAPVAVPIAPLVDPPSQLPGSGDLATADPIETWRSRPLAD